MPLVHSPDSPYPGLPYQEQFLQRECHGHRHHLDHLRHRRNLADSTMSNHIQQPISGLVTHRAVLHCQCYHQRNHPMRNAHCPLLYRLLLSQLPNHHTHSPSWSLKIHLRPLLWNPWWQCSDKVRAHPVAPQGPRPQS